MSHTDLRPSSSWLVAGLLLAVLSLLAAPARAQLNQPLHRDGWILAAAHAEGLHGSIWRTDLWLVADGWSPSITLTFCRSGEDGRGAEVHQLEVPGNDRVVFVEDVVDHFLEVGDDDWVGAIHYTASTDVQVWARVYSTSPDGTRTYGQVITGQASADLSPDNQPWNWRDHQWMFGVRHTSDGRFRVNVGIVNPTGTENDYDVAIFDSAGDRRRVEMVTVPPMSMLQLGDPFAGVDDGEWSDYRIQVVCTTEGGGGFAYASVVDNATNDAYFVRGVKGYPNDARPADNCVMHDDGWILAAARSPGLEGSIWRTDLWLAAPLNTWHAAVELSFHRMGEDGSQAPTFTLDLTDGPEVLYFEDVVEHFLGVGDDPWVGAIRYRSSNTSVQVWARVYSVNAEATASYGQLVEGIRTKDMSPDTDPWNPDDHQHIVATRHTADGRYRVNFGIVNPTAVEARYEIGGYGPDFNCPPGFGCEGVNVTVPPYSMVQLTDPFASWQDGEWSTAMFVVLCWTEGAGGFAYASVVDNSTNDAFFVRAIKLHTMTE